MGASVNKRRRFKVKRRRRALAEAWKHCRLLEGVLGLTGSGIRITPTPAGVWAAMDRLYGRRVRDS
jgi:hypothetical protein